MIQQASLPTTFKDCTIFTLVHYKPEHNKVTKRDYTLHVYTLGEGNCYLVVLMLVVTIFIKLLCFGYFSSSPWSSMTPQATRPPAFPVFLLPSSASPVPLEVTSLTFRSCYAGQLSLIASIVIESIMDIMDIV